MARPVYPYEMNDQDFAWLLETFLENNPGYKVIQESCLPLVLIPEPRIVEKEYSEEAVDHFIKDEPYKKLEQQEQENKG